MAAQRLVRESDQHKHGSADDEGKNAEIEQEHA
jgi:hypothetical protein